MSRPASPLATSLGFDPGPLIRAALREDLGPAGDVTTAAVVPSGRRGDGVIVTREELVLCGTPLAEAVFAALDENISVEWRAEEGQCCAAGVEVARVAGRLGPLLTGERTALNLLQHLSGIATEAARYAALLRGTGVRLLDTRKTTPGLRAAEKYAVRTGGCANHRSGLYDGILIKDNHIAAAGSVAESVRRARAARHPLLKIEVEVETEAEALEAVEAGAEMLLLDNRSPDELRALVAAVRSAAPGVLLEASGGITLQTVAEVAATGVDAISAGAVIHGARWVDPALELSAP